MKSVFTTLVIILVLTAIALFTVMYGGIFNVAATQNHTKLTHWILSATRESSIEKRAAGIEVPNLDDREMIKNGFRSYREMCAVCHTPPGVKDSPIAQGLNPPPPNLAAEAAELSDAELFWVIKNGIRMTGMPAWGVTHGDAELWDIVAFVKALPDISKEQYQELDRTTEAGHSHAGGSHDMGGHEAGGHDAGGHDTSSREHGHDTGQKVDDHGSESPAATAAEQTDKASDHHDDGHSHGEHTH